MSNFDITIFSLEWIRMWILEPVRLIARVVALQTNKRFLSAVNSPMGFQIEKFGTRLAALIAIVIFLYIRMNLVDFGHHGKF